jgi:hypothetical protein
MCQFVVCRMEDGRRVLMEAGVRPYSDAFWGFYGWRATLQ